MNFCRANRSAIWILVLVAAVISLTLLPRSVSAAAAQLEPTPEPSPTAESELTVYTVQSGDTLYAIATRFGISPDLLAAANNIDDPNRLSIGQRLLIPPPPAGQDYPPAGGINHKVKPGDTLHSLGLSYHSPDRELALVNHLVRPDQLIVGQSLLIPGADGSPAPLYGAAHTMHNGDTLMGIALRNNLALWTLAQTNMLESPLYAAPGTRLWIPGEPTDLPFFDWPDPFAAIELYPAPPVQGETFSIQISVTHPVSLTGIFDGNPLAFFPDKSGYAGLTGISALAEEVAPALIITATTQDGESVQLTQRVPVAAGDYGSETITVSPEVAAQMTAEVVDQENTLLAELFAARTPTRRWDRLFSLPTAGDITSSFGTRRTYNVPNASPYHTGTDFGRMVGTPVFAPADGTVVFTGTLTVRGNVIVIDHGWGVMTGYWHLSAIHVAAGDTVAAGEHIGDIGNTGLSTGPHLHWEMRVNGFPVSGLQWVREEFP